jgi:hypothetical protein
MKKPKKPLKAKVPASPQKNSSNPLLDMLENMDEDMLTMFQRKLREEMNFGPGAFGSEDAVDLFAEYIVLCKQEDADEDEKGEVFIELADELSDLKIHANGGDREARQKIQGIYEFLDGVLEKNELRGIDLMLIGKLLTDAGLEVPDGLKAAVAASLQSNEPESDEPGTPENDIPPMLIAMAEAAEANPFDVYDELNSLAAGLPAEACSALLTGLVAGKKASINLAMAGFLLHPDGAIAQAIGESLVVSAKQMPVTGVLLQRLVHMRPWLPPERQGHLDTTISAMRLNAVSSPEAELPKIIKCYASVCDGAGASSLLVTQKAGATYQIAGVMRKPAGVTEILFVRDLSKSEMDHIIRQFKAAAPTMETDLAGIARLMALMIAENSVSGKLPPFRLVEAVETLGLAPLHPDPASAAEIVSDLLDGLPPEEKDAAAVASAYDVVGDEFGGHWYEADEALDNLLHPVQGFKQRVAKVMKDYLPERRSFWARQCAMSALAMRGEPKKKHPLWKQLALVGRDIASDMPLDQIPLMKQIAETSVQVFEEEI